MAMITHLFTVITPPRMRSSGCSSFVGPPDTIQSWTFSTTFCEILLFCMISRKKDPLTKNMDFRPLKSRFFAPNPCEVKKLDFVQKIGISCTKAGFHRGLKSHFFAIPPARGRPRWNPWKMTLKSSFLHEIQLFARNPAFLHEIQLFGKTRWRGPW